MATRAKIRSSGAGPRMAVVGLALLTGCLALSPSEQIEGDEWIEGLLRGNPLAFGAFLKDPSTFRLQVLVSEVLEGDRPRLRRHGFRVDAEYFYPASAIKLCAAVAALEWLDELAEEPQAPDRDTPMRYHPLFEDERLEEGDPSNLEGGAITVGHEIRKLFLVSDNRAFNRLYELVGPRYLNECMWRADFRSVRCVHRLSELRSPEENRRSPRIDFLAPQGEFVVEERTSDLAIPPPSLARPRVGKAHVRGGERVAEPMDFSTKNSISLRDLQDALIDILRPDIELGRRGFRLGDEERLFLAEAMGEYPSQSRNPIYDSRQYGDDYVKFLLPGLERVVPKEQLRIYNKVGRAYGFSIENAYVVDGRTGASFFVSAVLYTNPNAILNDGVYAYEALADPFFADLGEALARRLFPPPSRTEGPASEGLRGRWRLTGAAREPVAPGPSPPAGGRRARGRAPPGRPPPG